MKILFYSINNIWAPHFETELELMAHHLEKKDEVFILTCQKSLKSCSSNAEHFKSVCMKCRSRFDQGINKIKFPTANIFYVKKTTTSEITDITFKSIEALKAFTFRDIALGLGVASSLISELRDHKFDTILHKEKIATKLQMSLLVYESMCEIIQKIKPDLCYIFNGRFADVSPAVAACKKFSVPFNTHERAGKATVYSLFKNSAPHNALDQIKQEMNNLWKNGSDDKQAIGAQWFRTRRVGADQSWFSFIQEQKKELLPSGFDRSKRNIALYNSSVDEYETFVEWKEPIYGQEDKALLAILDSFQQADFMFYFRVHPCLKGVNNTQIKRLKAIEAMGYANLMFIWPEDNVDTYALLSQCEKTVVFASTVGVEACFWEKASILIGRALYESLDCCYIPRSHQEVVSSIADPDLPAKSQLGALKYGYWEENRGIAFKKFQPKGLFQGAFMGEELRPKFGLRQRILLRVYDRLERWNKKLVD